jgi:hypothetical protein
MAAVFNDNCLRSNYTAARRILDLDNDDILYFNYHNSYAESPFFVAVGVHIKSTLDWSA